MNARATADSRRWLGLAALCSAFFMVILDVAIVNVALPTIQVDLDFSAKNLQWVVSAYALTFGGLAASGRAHGRPAGPAEYLHGRDRPVLGSLAPRRAGRVGQRPHPRRGRSRASAPR